MNYKYRLGNYLKAKNNSKNIITLTTFAILPLVMYFVINYKANMIIFIISLTIYLVIEKIIKNITKSEEKILIKDYYIYYSLINVLIIPYNIPLMKLVMISIISYILYKVLNKKTNVSLIVFTFIVLLVFQVNITTACLFVNKVEIGLLIAYLITLIFLYIIDYKINISYFVTIFIYLLINSFVSNDYLDVLSILSPVYVMFTLFIINDNNKINPTKYGRNLIGVLIGLFTIILCEININNYQVIALIVVSLLYYFIEKIIIWQNQLYIKKST